jgi:hypothetical protein
MKEVKVNGEDMARALEEVQSAGEELIRATAILSSARSSECAATNRLNQAQKTFDDLVTSMRTSAPQGSDWRRGAIPRMEASR